MSLHRTPCTRCPTHQARSQPAPDRPAHADLRSPVTLRVRTGRTLTNRIRRSVPEPYLRSGQFEARRTASSVALVFFWRIRGEVQRPGNIAPGRERYRSGLQDRPHRGHFQSRSLGTARRSKQGTPRGMATGSGTTSRTTTGRPCWSVESYWAGPVRWKVIPGSADASARPLCGGR